MSGVATAVVAGAVVGGIASNMAADKQASAATSAANTQAEANRYAQDVQYKMFQEQKALQEPWRVAGENALNKLTAGINTGQFGTATPFSFTAAEFNANQDPGYAFRLAEGNKALNQAAAARGGLISGNALKAAERYGQQMGSQEFQNAYNRALTGYNASQQARTNAYNQLAGVSGTGQTTAQQIGAAGQNYAANVGNLASATGASNANALMAGANARASSYTGIGSSIGQGLSGIGNYLRNYNSTNDLGANASLPYQINMASDTVYPGSDFTGGTYGPYQQ